MTLIGQPLTRREDPPLLTGQGRYVDDTEPTGTLHAFVVRSPLAHARITGIDVTDAKEAPGVQAVFTAADLAAQGVGPLPGAEGLPQGALHPAHRGRRGCPRRPLVRLREDRMRHPSRLPDLTASE